MKTKILTVVGLPVVILLVAILFTNTKVLAQTVCPYVGPTNGAPPAPGCSQYEQAKINDDAANCWVPKFEQAIKDLGFTPYRIAQYTPPSMGTCGFTQYNIGFQGLTVLSTGGTVGGNLETLLGGTPDSLIGTNRDPVALAKSLLAGYNNYWNDLGGVMPLDIYQKIETAATVSGYSSYTWRSNSSYWSNYVATAQKNASARIPLVVRTQAEVAATNVTGSLCPDTLRGRRDLDARNSVSGGSNQIPTTSPTLSFINLMCTALSNSTGNKNFNVGDRYRLIITGTPGTEITMQGGLGGGDGTARVMGSIPGSGVWIAEATLTSAQIGHWAEFWRVGNIDLNFLQYDVAAAGTPIPNIMYPTGYATSLGVAAMKATTVTLENLTTGNNKIFHVGDRYRIKVIPPNVNSQGANITVLGGLLGQAGPNWDKSPIDPGLPWNAGYVGRVGYQMLGILGDPSTNSLGTIKAADIGDWSQTWTIGANVSQDNQTSPGAGTYVRNGFQVAHFDFQVIPGTSTVTNIATTNTTTGTNPSATTGSVSQTQDLNNMISTLNTLIQKYNNLVITSGTGTTINPVTTNTGTDIGPIAAYIAAMNKDTTTANTGTTVTSFPSIITVTATNLNVRSAPSTSASLAGSNTLHAGDQFVAVGSVTGDNVEGENLWWKSSKGNYVWSGGTIQSVSVN